MALPSATNDISSQALEGKTRDEMNRTHIQLVFSHERDAEKGGTKPYKTKRLLFGLPWWSSG